MALTVGTCKKTLAEILKGNPRQSCALWGPPGVGKSSIIRQIADENKWGMTDVRLAQFGPDEFRGIPWPDAANGVCRWLRPDFLPTHGGVDPVTRKPLVFPHILLLDEFSCAPIPVRTASLQLVLDRRLDTWVAPDDLRIVLAGNRPEDLADVEPLSAPIKTRLLNFTIEPSLDDFKEFARGSSCTQKVVGFLDFRPELLMKLDADATTMPTPRTWTMLGETLEGCLGPSWGEEMSEQKRFIRNVAVAAVGEAAAIEFVAWLELYAGVDTDAILHKGQMPTGLATSRLDMKYAVLHAVVHKANRLESMASVAKNMLRMVAMLEPEFRMKFLYEVDRKKFLPAAMKADPAALKGFSKELARLMDPS